jgi:hypothetical protein
MVEKDWVASVTLSLVIVTFMLVFGLALGHIVQIVQPGPTTTTTTTSTVDDVEAVNFGGAPFPVPAPTQWMNSCITGGNYSSRCIPNCYYYTIRAPTDLTCIENTPTPFPDEYTDVPPATSTTTETTTTTISTTTTLTAIILENSTGAKP